MKVVNKAAMKMMKKMKMIIKMETRMKSQIQVKDLTITIKATKETKLLLIMSMEDKTKSSEIKLPKEYQITSNIKDNLIFYKIFKQNNLLEYNQSLLTEK